MIGRNLHIPFLSAGRLWDFLGVYTPVSLRSGIPVLFDRVFVKI